MSGRVGERLHHEMALSPGEDGCRVQPLPRFDNDCTSDRQSLPLNAPLGARLAVRDR
jgi:hypothetical protein